MTFDDILDQAIAMLQRRGRLTYRTLKRQFDLDDTALDDLKEELIYGQRLAVDEEERVLVWTGDAGTTPSPSASGTASAPTADHPPPPIAYTPAYLTEKILTSRSALKGERKQVTVLFADLKDSTELIRDLDPEEAQKLLDPAIHIMMGAVHRFEGTVNQVLGDGIMALFGAPVAHEDHAARACYAALAMQAAMHPYADEMFRSYGVTMQIRVGLNSGEVVVRTIGNDLHMDYSAVGHTTNLASRMEHLATPGSITLTGATLRLVEGLVRVNARGPVPVKGMSEPVEVYELTGASAVRRRLQAAVARGLTRFIGRETEIESLVQALGKAAAGQGQVVAAVGAAGLGKSRLFYEFLHSHRTQGWRVLESISQSYGKATPYFPIIDLLKRYGHVEDGDDARTIRAKLTGQVLTLDESLHDITPALLALCDVLPDDHPFLQLDPPQRRQRTLDGLKRLLLRESQEQPLVVVFEDLHWIDSETQALLDQLVESVPTAKLLLLVNYRPEYQHTWGSKTFYTQLRLDPLPPESADAFLAALLGDDPGLEPLKKLLIERTAGNPFFLEESVRTLVETEALAGEAGAYRQVQELPSIQVPDTVQAILAARIDRLPPEEKGLLQTAAVIGSEVPLPLLQAITELSEEWLYRGLTHLQAAEFLYETSLFPERIYTFKHALTHETAYGSLLQERRRMLHAHIVEALETLAGGRIDDQVERLAYHAFRGEVWDRAQGYFHQAGARAMTHAAYGEAVVCYEHAIESLQHLPERRDTLEQRIDLHLALRSALMPLGEIEQIFTHLRLAESLIESLGDRQRLGWVSGYLAHYFCLQGDQDRARDAAQREFDLAIELDHFDLQLQAHFHLGRAHQTLGNYHQAVELLGKNVTALTGDLRYHRARGAGLLSVISRTWLAWSLAELGSFAEGARCGDEGIRIAEAIDNHWSSISAHVGVGHVYLRQGDVTRAIAVLERGLNLCQEWHIRAYIPAIGSALGYAYALVERLPEALSVLEHAIEEATTIRILAGHTLWVAWRSETTLLAGRVEEALQGAEHALTLAHERKERGHQAWILRLLGAITMHRDPPEFDQAETYYHQALTLANELGMRPLQAHCHRGLGTLYSQTGQSEQARAALSTAIAMYRDMAMTFWLPETEAALAAVEAW
jgi:class 3 adenylate cyclase/tetratricopeptide (TPR) repeat protein